MIRAIGCMSCVLMLVAGAGGATAHAQVVTPGSPRVQMSDVTGPSVASLMLFEPGTIKTMDCAVAWGVRTTAEQIIAELSSGTLFIVTTDADADPTLDAQRAVLALVMDGSPQARAEVFSALRPENARAGRALVDDMSRLLRGASVMDPRRPGYRTAQGLSAAVNSFNDFLDRSSDAYLTTPPDAFLVIETVLSRLVVASLENHGRAIDAASLRGEYGLACAPPPVLTAPAAPPAPPVMRPPERAIELCVLEDGRMKFVPAIVLPLTADTLALVAGERVPFAARYPDVGYAGEMPWFTNGEAIRIGERRYVPYGRPLTMTPHDELVAAGSVHGVTVFTRKGAGATPQLVFVPAAPRCVVQPFQFMEDIRRK